MESHPQDKRRSSMDPEACSADGGNLTRGWEDLEDTLRRFRNSVHAAAERPETFWENQRSQVRAGLQRSMSARWRRPVLFWMPAAATVLLCLFLFVNKAPAPIPDFVVGPDQDLLIDIERSLNQPYPSALEPAALITQEMEQNEKTAGPEGSR